MAKSNTGKRASSSGSGRKKAAKQPKTDMMVDGKLTIVLGDDDNRPEEAEPTMKKLLLLLADYSNGKHLAYSSPVVVELAKESKGFLFYPKDGSDYERANKLTHFIVSNNRCEEEDEDKKWKSFDPCMTSNVAFAKAFSRFHFAAADWNKDEWLPKGITPIHPLLFLHDPSKTVVESAEDLYNMFWHMSWFFHTFVDDEDDTEATIVVQLDHWCSMIDNASFKANFANKIPTYPKLATALYKMFEELFMYKINAINGAVDGSGTFDEAVMKEVLSRMKTFTTCLKWSGEPPIVPAALAAQLSKLEDITMTDAAAPM